MASLQSARQLGTTPLSSHSMMTFAAAGARSRRYRPTNSAEEFDAGFGAWSRLRMELTRRSPRSAQTSKSAQRTQSRPGDNFSSRISPLSDELSKGQAFCLLAGVALGGFCANPFLLRADAGVVFVHSFCSSSTCAHRQIDPAAPSSTAAANSQTSQAWPRTQHLQGRTRLCGPSWPLVRRCVRASLLDSS